MGNLGELRHDLGRARQIARVMARHGFAPFLRRVPGLGRLISSHDERTPTEPVEVRFCLMLEELGPTFVKLGQILSMRSDLLPLAFTRELSRLQDQVPPVPFADVRLQIERGLGRPLDELFASVDENPLASASIAQVHAARLGDGADVVVKVQRPGIAHEIRADASILLLLARLLELVLEEFATYRVHDLAQEFERGLLAELDFTSEAQNLRAFRAFNQDREGVYVPRVFDELCCRTVVTMERVWGRRISDLAAEEDQERTRSVVERLVLVNFEHIFVDGMFHADPHPGNVLVREDGSIAFIDMGLMGRLARDTQDRMLILLLAITLRDADTLARVLVRVGDANRRVQLHEFRDAIRRLLDRYLGLAVGAVDSSSVLADLVELSSRFGMRMPRDLALLSKATVAIDGIVRSLHPTFEPSAQLSTRAQRLLVERFDPRDLQGGGLRAALQLGMLLQDLPLQLSQALLDLERGHLTLHMVSRDLGRLEGNLRSVGLIVFGGLVTSAMVLGGIVALARPPDVTPTAPFLPALCLVGAFLVGGATLALSLSPWRPKRLSAGAWLSTVLSKKKREL